MIIKLHMSQKLLLFIIFVTKIFMKSVTFWNDNIVTKIFMKSVTFWNDNRAD